MQPVPLPIAHCPLPIRAPLQHARGPLENRDLPPQRVGLAVTGLPEGWTWDLKGDGQPVSAAMVEPDKSVSLTLDIDPPDDVKPGRYDITVNGEAEGARLSLPITLTLERLIAARKGQNLELARYLAACRRAADRLGLIVSGEVDLAVRLAGGAAQARHLVELSLAEGYLAARATLGVGAVR